MNNSNTREIVPVATKSNGKVSTASAVLDVALVVALAAAIIVGIIALKI